MHRTLISVFEVGSGKRRHETSLPASLLTQTSAFPPCEREALRSEKPGSLGLPLEHLSTFRDRPSGQGHFAHLSDFLCALSISVGLFWNGHSLQFFLSDNIKLCLGPAVSVFDGEPRNNPATFCAPAGMGHGGEAALLPRTVHEPEYSPLAFPTTRLGLWTLSASSA